MWGEFLSLPSAQVRQGSRRLCADNHVQSKFIDWAQNPHVDMSMYIDTQYSIARSHFREHPALRPSTVIHSNKSFTQHHNSELRLANTFTLKLTDMYCVFRIGNLKIPCGVFDNWRYWDQCFDERVLVFLVSCVLPAWEQVCTHIQCWGVVNYM